MYGTVSGTVAVPAQKLFASVFFFSPPPITDGSIDSPEGREAFGSWWHLQGSVIGRPVTLLPHELKEYWSRPFYFRGCKQEVDEEKPSGRSHRKDSCCLAAIQISCNYTPAEKKQQRTLPLLVENIPFAPWKHHDASVSAVRSSVSSRASQLSVNSRISASLETDLWGKNSGGFPSDGASWLAALFARRPSALSKLLSCWKLQPVGMQQVGKTRTYPSCIASPV